MKDEKMAKRMEEIVEAAHKVFTSSGYRRARMADIASEMGVAPGTLYLYVQGKEALFDLVVRWELLGPDGAMPPQLPVATPPQNATLGSLGEALHQVRVLPSLKRALNAASPDDVEAELRSIIGELFDITLKYRRAILLIEKSAQDWPEMADLFYGEFRQGFFEELTAYLTNRAEAGRLGPIPDIAVAARMLIETIAWWTIHRFSDRDPLRHSDDAVRTTVVELLVRALHGEGQATGQRGIGRGW